MSYLDNVKNKRTEIAEASQKQASLDAFEKLSSEIRTLLSSLEKTGAKSLDSDFINAVKGLQNVANSLQSVKVMSDSDIKAALRTLTKAVNSIEVSPNIRVESPKVEVKERALDLSPIISAIQKLETKAPDVQIDLSGLNESVKEVKKAIKDLSFPTSNYILPYKDASKSTQALVDSDGHIQADILSMPAVTVDTTGLATTAKQDTIIGHLDGVETLLTTIETNQLPDGHNVTVDNASIAVTGTFWQATQPVSGTVTANLSATDNTVLDNIDTAVTSKYITGIGHGVKTVTTAGTDEALAGSTACKRVTIQAQTDNTSAVAIGASGVDATVATGTGILLYPGDVFELEIDNLADIYVDSLVNGEGVRYAYFT